MLRCFWLIEVALVGGLLLLLPGRAAGATWTLLNGDHLSGELVTEFEDLLVIKHDSLGLLEIPRSALAVGAVPAGEANAGVLPVGAVKTVRKPWKRQLEFGFVQKSGIRSQQNLSVRGQFDGLVGANTLRATARLLQSSVDGIRQEDRLDADFRWRHALAQRFFIQSLSTGSTDRLRQIDLSLEEQVGAGWRVVTSKAQQANLGVGVAVRHQENMLAGASTGMLGTLFQDYAYSLRGGIRFSEESSLAYSGERSLSAAQGPVGPISVPASGDNYRLRFAASLQGRAIGRTIFNLRYEYDYDRSVLVPDYRADRRLTTSLGYIW